MKAHKRLMQSLRDSAQVTKTVKVVDWSPQHPLRLPEPPAMLRTLAEDFARQLAVAAKGDIRFVGAKVERFDGEKWHAYRMPGMHRRNGKWVRR
jgi:hypothetical protein